jgi:sec-independent protein translocase protein TatA
LEKESKNMSLRSFGIPELLIILVIIILLFGVGRIGKVAGELGKGIRSFKEGLQGGDKKEEEVKEEGKTVEPK